MKCLTLLLATRSKAADGSEDCRAQTTQKENNNNLKNHDKLAVCQFTWLLGITTALSLMKDEFQGKRGSTWQKHLYYGLFRPESIQGIEEKCNSCNWHSLKKVHAKCRSMGETPGTSHQQAAPNLVIVAPHFGSKFISKGGLSSISAKWYGRKWY